MHPNLDALESVLAQRGLPPLRGLEQVGREGALIFHRLRFEGPHGDLLLTRQLWHTGFAPLESQAAAANALMLTSVPSPSGLQLLPAEACPEPATLASVAWAPTAPDPVHQLHATGHALAALAEVTLRTTGTRAEHGHFAPRRLGWREDWLALARAEHAEVERLGLADLPEVRALWPLIEDAIESLPEVPQPTLVLFGLEPMDLVLDPRGDWIGTRGLERALAGDAVAGWASLIGRLTGEHLATVMEAAGTSPAALAPHVRSLTVYAATHTLRTIRVAGQRLLNAPSKRATRNLDRALALARAVAAPDYVALRLDGAHAGSSLPAARPTGEATIGLRALWALGSSPLLTSDRAHDLLGALGADGLAAHEGHASHFTDVGHQFLQAADLPRGRLATEPRDPSWASRLADLFAAEDAGGPAVAIALAARVIDRVEQGLPLPGGCAAGLEALVLAVLRREASVRSGSTMPPHVRVVHGLLGAHAAHAFDLPAHAGVWLEQLTQALTVIEAGHPPLEDTGLAARELIHSFALDFSYPGEGRLVLPAVEAAWKLDEAGRLPVAPARVLHACAALIVPRGHERSDR